MGIGSLKSRIRSGLDTLSSKCETLVGGTKNRVSDILGKTLLASTLAFASGVATADQSDTSKGESDNSSWSIAYNVPSSAQGNLIDAIKNTTFDTLMAPIVFQNTKSQEQSIDISDQEILLKRASDYQSKLLTDHQVIEEIQKIPSKIQKDVEKNAESYTEKTDLESKLSGFLHKNYGKESTQIQVQDVKFHIHGVRSSEGNKKNHDLAKSTVQDGEKIIKDVFMKSLPSVGINTDSSAEVHILTPTEKEFLHQTAKKYKLSEYHLIQGYNNGRGSFEPDERRSMKQIFDNNRHLSISGNAHYTRTDTHNTPLPIGAFGLLVGGVLVSRKLLKKKDDIIDRVKSGIGEIQGFLKNGFRALSGIFSSKKPVETVADRMRVNIKQTREELEEHKKFNPDETFDSGDVGTHFEEELSSITSIPVLEDILYNTTLSSAEIAILRSKDLTTRRGTSQVGVVQNSENQVSVSVKESEDPSFSDGEKIDPVSKPSEGNPIVVITIASPDAGKDGSDKSTNRNNPVIISKDSSDKAVVSQEIEEQRELLKLRACIDRLDAINDAIFQGMDIKNRSKIEKYLLLYRQLLISTQWSESKIFLEGIISDFKLPENHLLVLFKKELVDTCEVQSDFPLKRMLPIKRTYVKRVCMMKSGKTFTSKERMNIKIGKNRGEAEILYISDTDIQVIFRRENLPIEKHTLSRRDFESSLESYELDHIFEQYKKSDESDEPDEPDEPKESKKLIFSIIAKGMYQNPNFAPKKEIILDDGSIFYITERFSIHGSGGVTQYCGIYRMLDDRMEGWVFMKGNSSQKEDWRCMPHASENGPQNYFSNEKGKKTVSLRDDLRQHMETIGLSSDSLSLMDLIRPLYPTDPSSKDSSSEGTRTSSIRRKVA